MSFDSVTHVVSWLFGLAWLAFFAVLLFLEVRLTAPHTVHIGIFAGGMLVGLIIMGYAASIAAGLQALGGAVGRYLPWTKGGAS